MSDARTQAIRKLSAELIQELVNASGEDGGERWIHIAIRKMEQVPDRAPLKLETSGPMVRIGAYLLSKLGERISANRMNRNPHCQPGGEDVCEVDQWDAKEIAKLKRWLNGE